MQPARGRHRSLGTPASGYAQSQIPLLVSRALLSQELPELVAALVPLHTPCTQHYTNCDPYAPEQVRSHPLFESRNRRN